MNENNKNYQIDLIKNLANRIFLKKEFNCAIIIAKNPQLLSLYCCLEAKITIHPPYPPGTNFYYPIDKNNVFRRIKVKSYQVENDLGSYWYEEANGVNQSICNSWKLAKEFESNAILASEQEAVGWIRKRDVSGAKLNKHSGCIFPQIVSTSRDFEYWLKEDIGNSKSLLEMCGFESIEEFKTAANFINPRSVRACKEQCYIWINSLPDFINEKNHIVLLAPDSNRFEDFNYDINCLYENIENKKIWRINELSEDLQLLVKNSSITTPASIWSLV